MNFKYFYKKSILIFVEQCVMFFFLFNTVNIHSHQPKIIGIGEELLDVAVFIKNEETLGTANIGEEKWRSCDQNTLHETVQILADLPSYTCWGGGAANTIRTLAKLGADCAFLGSNSVTTFKENFPSNVQPANVLLPLDSHQPPSTVLCIVLPDGERRYLSWQSPWNNEINPESFRNIPWVYLESFLLPLAPIEQAMQLAKKEGSKIIFALGSSVLVETYKKEMLQFLNDYVDIVFCNAAELEALTGLDLAEGCLQLQNLCSIAVVTNGGNGCIIGHEGKVLPISTQYIDSAVDTGGAGDYFAAGFLYGYFQGYSLSECAQIGHILGGEVIQVRGTILPEKNWEKIRKTIHALNLPKNQSRRF